MEDKSSDRTFLDFHDKISWKNPDFASKRTEISRFFDFMDSLPPMEEFTNSNSKAWIFLACVPDPCGARTGVWNTG